jgi:hypothetical protein
VARLYGQYRDKTAVILPDGQLGIPDLLVPAEEPFVPLSAEALRARLNESPLGKYQVLSTQHYLIYFKSQPSFAENSGRALEELYRGMIDVFRKHGIPVHDAEFPMVAVIFATEFEFRKHKDVGPEVQACYEFFTNRIFFYERSEQDLLEPKLTALRQPQTVAHEGVHQILANLGVQPRLSAWPLWLTEGLAEYCATPANTRKGVSWERLGMINSLHMATLRELDDPLSNHVEGRDDRTLPVAREPRRSRTESLILKTALTPTDYAEAWALTHYLAQKRGADFIKFLKAMSQMPPLEPRTPAEQLAEFRKFFGDDLFKIDKKEDDYIRWLSRLRSYDPLPFYVVMVEQPLGGGTVHRRAKVSQSPQIIQQWLLEISAADGGIGNWQAVPQPTRARAVLMAQEWIHGD